MYNFPLSKSVFERNMAWADAEWWSPEQVEKVKDLGASFAPQKGTIFGGDGDDPRRSCEVRWVRISEETKWLYDQIGAIVCHLNGKFFGFDLTGFEDGLQYTVYHHRPGDPISDHYDFHKDMGGVGTMCRKLSFVLQLSDPLEYDGGDLVVESLTTELVPKGLGKSIVFPSWARHKVTPVTRGVRRSLVAWAVGPEFR